MIVQNTSAHGTTDISFTVPKTDLAVSVETAQAHADKLGATGVASDRDVSRVSLIGAGMKSHPGIAALMFETLANEEINIDMISHLDHPHLVHRAHRRRRTSRAIAARRLRTGLMPRTLWLLRHAKTVTDPPHGGTDFDRVLAPRGRRDATALGRVPVPQGHAARTGPGRPADRGAGVTGGPHHGHGRTGAGRLVEPTGGPDALPDLYGADPNDVLDLLRQPGRRHHARSWWWATTRRPTRSPSGLIDQADKKGHALAVTPRLSHLRAGRLHASPSSSGGSWRATRAKLGRPVDPALRRGLSCRWLASSASAGWRRHPDRHHRTAPRRPCWRRGGAARAARSAPPGCRTCRPGDRGRWRHR